jgi:hypothetical protein
MTIGFDSTNSNLSQNDIKSSDYPVYGKSAILEYRKAATCYTCLWALYCLNYQNSPNKLDYLTVETIFNHCIVMNGDNQDTPFETLTKEDIVECLKALKVGGVIVERESNPQSFGFLYWIEPNIKA